MTVAFQSFQPLAGKILGGSFATEQLFFHFVGPRMSELLMAVSSSTNTLPWKLPPPQRPVPFLPCKMANSATASKPVNPAAASASAIAKAIKHKGETVCSYFFLCSPQLTAS
jgi:hypothetical protein